ncbi:MAG: class I SAM-dependent RNA methyltransferase [Planctomycetes bacterium]|nr:class I SAM-dependent RNA methyltransferase [Planctomycetota bacterium]
MSKTTDAPLHCPHFGRCGGCSQLDVPIAEQLARKRRHATELLQAFLDGQEVAIAPGPRTPRHDRTTILYPVQLFERQATLGIYRTGTHLIEPIRDCRIQHKALTLLGVRAGDVLRKLNLPVYNEETHKGFIRAFRARVMPGSNELMVGIISTRREFSERETLGKMLWDAASNLRDEQGKPLQLVGVALNINEVPGNAMLGPTTMALRGRSSQTDTVAGLKLQVSFTSFYQHNRHADAILFRPALAMLGDVTGLRIVDGYGGIGAFGLRLLKAGAGHVTIGESSPVACEDARVNLRENGFSNGEVREQLFGSAPLPECDVLVVDPPRAGLQEIGCAAVLAAKPPRVLLVSCSLESLARDLALLHEHYRTVAVRLCDLFPHTEHVEAVTLLERR